MTDDFHSSNNEGEADPTNPRKVAKTMLEQNLPQAQKPGVAKTMLESELPSSNSGLNTQARRKVAKTLIDHSVTEEKVLEAAAMQEQMAKNTQERPRIAKTLVEHSLQSYYENSEQPYEPQSGAADYSGAYQTPETGGYSDSSNSPNSSYAPTRGPSQNFVAKTMLDHSLLFDALAKSSAKKEQKAAEVAAVKALEPEVPFVGITKFKIASPCSWSWEETDTRERFRYCGQCQASVYNFEGLELPEAKALVFKRENRDNAPLYKRADGKFMTTDCPVTVKKKRDQFSIAAVVAAIVVAFILIAMMAPPAPPPAPTPAPEASNPRVQGARPSTASNPNQPGQANHTGQPNAAGGSASSTAAGKPIDGSFHWDNTGASGQATTTSTTSTPVDVPPATNASENGSNWEFSGGGNDTPGTQPRPVLPGVTTKKASPYTDYSMR